jgi:hypothetical protein
MGIFDIFRGQPKCYKCGVRMTIVSMVIERSSHSGKTAQSGFQCTSCGRYTCYDCSDYREECKCGSKQWKQKLYIER